MKYIIVAAVLALAPLSASADDFSRFEGTARAEVNGLGVDVRANINSPERAFGIDYTLYGFTGRYERVEDDGEEENRLSLAYNLQVFELPEASLFAGAKATYRIPDENVGEDWVELSPSLTLEVPVVETLTGYAAVQPNFSYGLDGNEDFVDARDTYFTVGAKYQLNQNVQLKPFVRLEADSDFNKQELFGGMIVTASF